MGHETELPRGVAEFASRRNHKTFSQETHVCVPGELLKVAGDLIQTPMFFADLDKSFWCLILTSRQRMTTTFCRLNSTAVYSKKKKKTAPHGTLYPAHSNLFSAKFN